MACKHVGIRVPGKLMIAGEYAVLEPCQEAVVAAVDRYVTARISFRNDNRLFLPGIGLPNISFSWTHRQIDFSIEDSRLHYIEVALTTVLNYLACEQISQRPFHLSIESELDDPDGRKYGLGSSAAVVVAVISAILHLYGVPEPLQELTFRLSAVAHFRAQGSGSGADVAASTFGGWLQYASFDSEWLAGHLAADTPLLELIQAPWPDFRADRLNPPDELHLCVGWTGEPAATAPLVKKVRAMRERNRAQYDQFLTTSRDAVSKLVHAFAIHDISLAIEAFAENRVALSRLGEQAGVPIETQRLYALNHLAVEFGGAGKPSGAGGGDCGIALLASDEAHMLQLYEAWREAGIEPLDIQVSPEGAHVIDS